MGVAFGSKHWRNRHQIALERVAIERVVASVRADGHEVSGLWFPDLERDDPRVAGRKTPDGAMTIDGGSAAIDVTWALAPANGRAKARASRIRHELADRIVERPGATVVVFAIFDPAILGVAKDPTIAAGDVDLLEAAIDEVLERRSMDRFELDPTRLPAWVISASVIVHPRAGRAVDVLFMPRRDTMDELAARLGQLRVSKGSQLAAWGRGIVAIMHGDDRFDDLVTAFVTDGPWPWWRVYWIDAGGARLVWSEGRG